MTGLLWPFLGSVIVWIEKNIFEIFSKFLSSSSRRAQGHFLLEGYIIIFHRKLQGRNSELLSVLLMMMYGLSPINLSFSNSKPTILMTQPNFEVLFGVRNIIINFGIGICDSFEVACLRRCSEEELESYRFSIKNVLSAEDILSLHIFKHQQICLKNNIWWDLRLRRIWNKNKKLGHKNVKFMNYKWTFLTFIKLFCRT